MSVDLTIAETKSVKRPAERTRQGFTLMELVLVMAIIVLMGALAAPAFLQTLARQKLDKSADRVRIAMGQARVKAIRTGEIHAVYINQGGSWFNVAPFSQARFQASLVGQRQQMADLGMQTDFEEDLLPMGIVFAGSESAVDARAAEALSGGDGGGLRPILFYPDGTSQDARVILRNEKNQFVEVQLRGLTGLPTVIRIEQPLGSR